MIRRVLLRCVCTNLSHSAHASCVSTCMFVCLFVSMRLLADDPTLSNVGEEPRQASDHPRYRYVRTTIVCVICMCANYCSAVAARTSGYTSIVQEVATNSSKQYEFVKNKSFLLGFPSRIKSQTTKKMYEVLTPFLENDYYWRRWILTPVVAP